MKFKKGQKPWNKGKKLDKATIEKISKSKAGSIPWNKGKKCPQISKGKMGKNRPDMVGNTYGFVKGKPSPRKGERGKNTCWNKNKRAKDDSRILIGKNHPRWKGGISRPCKMAYSSADYKKWRLTVFTRDNFTCQGCQKVGGYLNAHHIKGFTHYPKLRFVVDNGITLCLGCHKLTHNYGGKANSKS